MLVPKLRFKREDGTDYPEWETRQLHNVFVERNETQTIAEDAPLLSFTIEQGVINPEDKKTNKRDFLIKDKDNKKYALTEYNDIIYNPANLKFGAIHRNKLGRGVVSPIYAIFHTGENPIFMEYIVTNPVFIKKSLKYLEGTVIKLMTLKPRDFLLMKCNIPCLEEQQKIADFLSTVDEVIAQSEAEVQNLEQQKKAAMQKIFSQEVRFKREDGTYYPEWAITSLNDVCDIIGGGTPSTENNDYWNGDIQWFTPSEIGKTKYVSKSARTISQVGFEKSSARKLPAGTILLTSRATLGEMAIATTECTTNQGFQSLIPQKINGEYLYYLQPVIKNYCNKKACGSTFNEISKGELGKYKIPMPDIEEQQKIADFLSAYDEAIRYAKQELDKWKELKKGLLQQMFV